MIKSAIVTGATGAVGSALINELINRNIEVLVFTRKDSKRNSNIPNNSLVTIKNCSLDEIKTNNNDENKTYDVFFHLAWSGTTGPSRNDKEIQNNNIEYALDAVMCAKRYGCKKFIGVGSQAEYGISNKKLNKNTATNPETEYGKAKLKTSIVTKELSNKLGMSFNWIRILSVYGKNDTENSLISYAINKFKNNETLSVTKCEQIWDYLNSKDAARALYLVADKGYNGKVYVIGSGKERILRDYIEDIKNVINSLSAIDYGAIEYSPKQVMYLCADISEITKDTGWEPKIEFIDGVRELV